MIFTIDNDNDIRVHHKIQAPDRLEPVLPLSPGNTHGCPCW